MKGWRTIVVGLGIAIGPAALGYLGDVDWASYVGPTTAFFISGAITVFMRFVTNTPVGQKY